MLNEKQIKKLNDKFKSLGKAEQRVLIAKDVLAQVRKKKYNPITGTYITMKGNHRFYDSIQEHIDAVECSCCALGACLISTTKFKNKLQFTDVDGLKAYGDAWSLLKGIFSPVQLSMIEYAFEAQLSGTRVGERYFDTKIDSETRYKSIDFGRKFDTDKKRMVGIMENIIKNKGTFKP